MISPGGFSKKTAPLIAKMKIAFRTDASSQIGTGHFMRCLTLADALKQRGAQVRFICRHLPEYLQNMLVTKEYESVLLKIRDDTVIQDDLAHSNWLGSHQHADAQDSIHALSDQSWDWLVVDHYALDCHWESVLRQTASHILVIDDIADRQHDCDILLDQNYYADMDTRYIGKVPAHCRLFLGPQYALLRDEFRKLREKVKPRTGMGKRMLVFFGGVDAENYTGHIIEALGKLSVEAIQVAVVIGEQHPCRRKIEAACAEYKFTCHVQTDRMAELMAAADVAIGAGGSATWERCCLGLPALIVALANNQTEIAKGLDRLGAGRYIESQTFFNDAALHKAIRDLLQNNQQIKMLSQKAYSVVDGLGVDRLCEAMVC